MLLLEKRRLEVGLRSGEMESLLADIEGSLSRVHSVLILVPTLKPSILLLHVVHPEATRNQSRDQVRNG